MPDIINKLQPVIITDTSGTPITGGSSGGSGGGTYTSVVVNATGNGSIPIGVRSWSASAISGTVTVGGVSLPVGGSFGGGGYLGLTSSAAINYTVSGGVLLVSYDL